VDLVVVDRVILQKQVVLELLDHQDKDMMVVLVLMEDPTITAAAVEVPVEQEIPAELLIVVQEVLLVVLEFHFQQRSKIQYLPLELLVRLQVDGSAAVEVVVAAEKQIDLKAVMDLHQEVLLMLVVVQVVLVEVAHHILLPILLDLQELQILAAVVVVEDIQMEEPEEVADLVVPVSSSSLTQHKYSKNLQWLT